MIRWLILIMKNDISAFLNALASLTIKKLRWFADLTDLPLTKLKKNFLRLEKEKRRSPAARF